MSSAPSVSDIPATQESVAPASILLVDDDSNNLLALESILESPEHDLVKARNAEEALLALMHDDFAVIVLDVQMPDISGIELARLIKQRKRTQHIPIIFLTAHYRESEHAVLGYDVGAVDYLTKPVHPGVLRSKVSVFVDLHRKTQALEELNRSMQAEILERKTADERFRVVVEAAPSAMLLLTPEGEITFLNSQAENLFATDHEQLLGRLVTEFLDSDGLPDFSLAPQPLNSAATGGVPPAAENVIEIHEASLTHADGSTVPVEASFRPIQSREGFRWLATIVDITERKRAESALRTANAELAAKNEALQREAEERQLRQRAEAAQAEAEAANAAKDRFLAMLSHELRTPLSPVLHTVALLNEDPASPPSVRDALRVIHRNVQLEARLIDDLLDLARIRNGKLELQLQPVEAHEILHNAVEICRPDIQSRRLTVGLHLDAEQTTLMADPARLQQIFWNLINNAVKFTPSRGVITISTENNEDGQLQVEVKDTGVGIRNDKLRQIFEAFEQAAQRGTSSGLGLGLAICKALTEFHGGKISAHSEGPGEGACFMVTLPLSRIPLSERPLEKPVSQPSLTAPMRLLVVEDHQDTADTLRRLLLLRGYEVRCAGTVAQALEVARGFRFDILVTDIGLPDGTGVDLFQCLRKRQGDGFRGVALSGFGMDEDIARSKAAGFVSHITKPVDFIQLQRCLVEISESLACTNHHQ